MTMCRSGLRQPAVVFLTILLFALTGCARRKTASASAVPPPPATAPSPAAPNAPPNVSQRLREVAILYNNIQGTAEVVSQLRKLLPLDTYRLTLVDLQAGNSPRVLTSLKSRAALFTVAIGLPAARIARDEFRGPVVFAQVFNYKELLVEGRAIRGVAAMPPFDLQVRDWKKFDPQIRRVGLIVSPTHTDLVPQAELAARNASITVKHEVSGSDRETLYLFKRLAPQIDGLWLIPDDRILSPAVLRDLMAYAVTHRVRICVFNDSLLDWGALMSASATPTDTARTLHRVLETMMAGRTNALPPLTPLSELAIRINTSVAGRLGISPSRVSWVVRGER